MWSCSFHWGGWGEPTFFLMKDVVRVMAIFNIMVERKGNFPNIVVIGNRRNNTIIFNSRSSSYIINKIKRNFINPRYFLIKILILLIQIRNIKV